MKLMKKTVSFILALAVMVGLTACGSKPATEGELEKVTLVLDWTPNTNHTGFYVAQAEGFYKEAGIELDILQPPDSGPLPLVAAGNGELAITFQEDFGPALALEDPLPLTAISTVIAHNTSGIISLKDSQINSPKDLEGKKVATWDSPVITGMIRDLVEGDGGDFDKVNLVFDNVTDIVSALEADVDAVWIYYAWDGIATQVKGLDTNFFYVSDENPIFDYYTPIIVANNSWLKDNPETAKSFVEATAKGYEYAIANPEKSAEILLKAVPELDSQLINQSQQYLAEQYQADSPQWGEIDPTRWENFYDRMYSKEILESPVGGKGFTNEFLPK